MIKIPHDDVEAILAKIVDLGKNAENSTDLRNYSERLCFLCSIILKKCFGERFNGIYPFCGLDVLTPYLLGGTWLLFDASWNDYQTEIPNYQIPYFQKALTSDRLTVIDQSIESSTEAVVKFNPEVILIKYAGEGNYERIFDFLIQNFTLLPILVISCTSRKLEKYLEPTPSYRLTPIRIGLQNEITIGRQLQPFYQTFYFFDRLKLFELSRKLEPLSKP